MAQVRRGSSTLVRSARRQTGWSPGPKTGVAGAALGLTASSVNLGAISIVPTQDGLTVIRIRGELTVHVNTASALNDGFSGAFGIAVANETALGIGVTAVNTPITDEGWDGWMYHRYFSVKAPGPLATANVSTEMTGIAGVVAALRTEVDTKAMRKLPVGVALYCALEVVEVGIASARWAFNSRALFKLP